MQKIVINSCFGGFGLSQEACKRLVELGLPLVKGGEEPESLFIWEDEHKVQLLMGHWRGNNRSHPLLVQVVEELWGGSEQ